MKKGLGGISDVEFDEWLNSPETNKAIDESIKRIHKEQNVLNNQLERFHNKIQSDEQFEEFVEKVIEKYENLPYTTKKCRGRMLYSFLLKYAEKYGMECTDEVYQKYDNPFLTSLYHIRGYNIGLMIGQGAIVVFYK